MKKLIKDLRTTLSSFKAWEAIGFVFFVTILGCIIIAGMTAFFYIAYWVLK